MILLYNLFICLFILGIDAYKVCEAMMRLGVLAKPTHHKSIRLAPPLIINESQIDEATQVIEKALIEVHSKK